MYGGFHLHTLLRTCGLGGGTTCGRSAHVELGFGSHATYKAAEYSAALVSAYAAGLKNVVLDRAVLEDTSRSRLKLSGGGRVKRHLDRGETSESKRERRAEEDVSSYAGSVAAPPFCLKGKAIDRC